jgi:hypothetical protein
MAQEIIYTSVPRGLFPGRKGYCTVAATRAMPDGLVRQLEAFSTYRHLSPSGSQQPASSLVVYSHLVFSFEGKSTSLLSRISDAPLDYSGRSNYLAHHIALAAAEHVPAGPAAVVAQRALMTTAWSGDPRFIDSPRPIGQVPEPSGACNSWRMFGMDDAGWIGELARLAQDSATPAAHIIFRPDQSQHLLGLLKDAVSLLSPQARWRATFSTFFTGLPPGVDCCLRFVVAGSPEAEKAVSNRQVPFIDLGNPGPLPNENHPLVKLARAGERYQSSRPQAARATTVDTPPLPDSAEGADVFGEGELNASDDSVAAQLREAEEEVGLASGLQASMTLAPTTQRVSKTGRTPDVPGQNVTPSTPPVEPEGKNSKGKEGEAKKKRFWTLPKTIAAVFVLFAVIGGGVFFAMNKDLLPDLRSLIARNDGESESGEGEGDNSEPIVSTNGLAEVSAANDGGEKNGDAGGNLNMEIKEDQKDIDPILLTSFKEKGKAPVVESSNEKILTISEPVWDEAKKCFKSTLTLVPNKSGTVEIAAKAKDAPDDQMKVIQKITVIAVNEPPTLVIDGGDQTMVMGSGPLTVNLSDITPGPGESGEGKLVVKSHPEGVVNSEDSEVRDGKATLTLTAVKPGDTKITVAVTDVDGQEHPVSFSVKVKKAPEIRLIDKLMPEVFIASLMPRPANDPNFILIIPEKMKAATEWDRCEPLPESFRNIFKKKGKDFSYQLTVVGKDNLVFKKKNSNESAIKFGDLKGKRFIPSHFFDDMPTERSLDPLRKLVEGDTHKSFFPTAHDRMRNGYKDIVYIAKSGEETNYYFLWEELDDQNDYYIKKGHQFSYEWKQIGGTTAEKLTAQARSSVDHGEGARLVMFGEFGLGAKINRFGYHDWGSDSLQSSSPGQRFKSPHQETFRIDENTCVHYSLVVHHKSAPQDFELKSTVTVLKVRSKMNDDQFKRLRDNIEELSKIDLVADFDSVFKAQSGTTTPEKIKTWAQRIGFTLKQEDDDAEAIAQWFTNARAQSEGNEDKFFDTWRGPNVDAVQKIKYGVIMKFANDFKNVYEAQREFNNSPFSLTTRICRVAKDKSGEKPITVYVPLMMLETKPAETR